MKLLKGVIKDRRIILSEKAGYSRKYKSSDHYLSLRISNQNPEEAVGNLKEGVSNGWNPIY
jgi:hypothetical protein